MNKKLTKENIKAVKIVPKPRILKDKEITNLLKNEIKFNFLVNHPAFPKLEEIQEIDEGVLLIFEYISGPLLGKSQSSTPNSLEEIRTVIKKILEAILYLSKNKIVHRDLKFGNIMLEKKGDFSSLKIIDFGLSSRKYSLTKGSTIRGTPGYMAPEMFSTQPGEFWRICNSKLDIFSIGAIFHILLFNEEIFTEGEKIGKCEKNEKGDITISNFDDLKANLRCKEAYELMKWMLELDPQERCTPEMALEHRFFKIDLKNSKQHFDVVEENEECNLPILPEPKTHLNSFKKRVASNTIRGGFFDSGMFSNQKLKKDEMETESGWRCGEPQENLHQDHGELNRF